VFKLNGLEEDIYSLLLALSLALVIGKLLEDLAIRVNLPPVIGDLLGGLILGASFLAIYPVTSTIETLAWFGVILLLFYAGMETRYRTFMRNLGIYGMITIGEALAAFTVGYLIGTLFGYPPLSSFFIGAVLEATSVSVSIKTLIDIGKLATPEGYAILGVAVLDDLAALITIIVGKSLISKGIVDPILVVEILVTSIAFWFLLVITLHKASNVILLKAMKLRVSEGAVAIVLGIFAFLAYATKYVELSPLIAAYAAGLALSEARGVGRIAERIRPLALILSTLYFTSITASLDIKAVVRSEFIVFYLLFILGAVTGKVLGAGLTSYLIGFPKISALRIATGLLPRAEFCIIAAYVGYTAGLFGGEVYLAAILVVFTTNIFTPVIIKTLFTRGPEIDYVRLRIRRGLSV